MTPRQIELVQESVETLQPVAQDAARLFYGRLFEIDPSLRRMFRGDMDLQGRLLMQMITFAARSLREMDKLAPVVESLGRRHAGYGVRDEHYGTVAAALLWTLEQGLGAAFTDELKQAWTETYVALATLMQKGAAAAVAEASDISAVIHAAA